MKEEALSSATAGSRRPLKSRATAWARMLTAALLRTRVTPDQISIAGVVFAAIGSLVVLYAPEHPLLFLAAAGCIQLRLLCNMLDGLVAVEGGRGSVHGALYNELPDRLEDSLFLVGFGVAAGVAWLGLLDALLAAVTAYVRVLGGTLGQAQDFGGPMAKPHRMAALTLTALVAAVEAHYRGSAHMLYVGLLVIGCGTLWTIVARTRRIARRVADARSTPA